MHRAGKGETNGCGSVCGVFSGGGGPYQDRTVNAGVAIGRGLPGGVGGLFLK